MKTVEGLFYSKDHEWIKVEGSKASIGITDYAQNALGEIVYIELPEVDDEFAEGDVFSVVESVKAASDSYLPISGKIVEVNEQLDDSPQLVNEDAYGAWLVVVEMENEDELKNLMNEQEYKDFCSEVE